MFKLSHHIWFIQAISAIRTGKITMYENIKLFQHDGECPLGIHFVGETLCDEKYCIERRNSDNAYFKYDIEF